MAVGGTESGACSRIGLMRAEQREWLQLQVQLYRRRTTSIEMSKIGRGERERA